ncbi:MAG: hypothetical protein HYY63_04090, partial [Elusimicrobia bacterium]|nr:hypothetical protein [Elusimicrobiota bacterium]
MKKLQQLLVFLLLETVCLPLLTANLWAYTMQVDDFDEVRATQFSFKDEKGTTLKIQLKETNTDRNQVMTLKYNVVKDGWAGWGLVLKGADLGN